MNWIVRPFVAYKSLITGTEVREDFNSQDAAIARYRELARIRLGTKNIHLCMGTVKVQRA
jgi:hypothetical protein